MSAFLETLLDGNEKAFKPASLTPMQKLTLQYVVFGLVYYAFAAIEGMLMRLYEVQPFDLIAPTGAGQVVAVVVAAALDAAAIDLHQPGSRFGIQIGIGLALGHGVLGVLDGA